MKSEFYYNIELPDVLDSLPIFPVQLLINEELRISNSIQLKTSQLNKTFTQFPFNEFKMDKGGDGLRQDR